MQDPLFFPMSALNYIYDLFCSISSKQSDNKIASSKQRVKLQINMAFKTFDETKIKDVGF